MRVFHSGSLHAIDNQQSIDLIDLTDLTIDSYHMAIRYEIRVLLKRRLRFIVRGSQC